MASKPTSDPTSQKDIQRSEETNSSHILARTGSKCSLFGQVSRRSFLGRAGVLTATGVVTGVMSPLVSSARKGNIVLAQDKVRRVRSFNYENFVQKAYKRAC